MPASSSAAPFPVIRQPARPDAWFGGNMPFARVGVILNLVVPGAFLLADALHHTLGADPVKEAIHATGLIAVTYLLLSLCVTPLRLVSGWSWVVQFRRAVGVYAFYYAAAHLAIYYWWDRERNLSSAVYEITHRYYLMIGFISLVLMAPLWATSFNAAIRAMGGVWWRRLHRLAYVATGLACWHFYLQTKADKRRPDIYFAVFGVLMLWRVVAFFTHRARAGSAVAATPARAASTGFWKGELKVIEMRRETDAVRTFRLAPMDGGAMPFTHKAGQFLNLSVEIDGKRVSRSYTIASPPTRDRHIELTIKREENGHVSRFLHDKLMNGHGIAISAPAGRFTFDAASHHAALLIAGGVGITPVMSILRELTDRVWPGKIDLVFSVRSPGDVIFGEELKELCRRHPNVRAHVTITRDAPANWTGLKGRITADLLRELVPDVAQRPAYICGPDAMANAAREELLKLGVPSASINLESFTPAAAVAKDNGVRPETELSPANTATVTFTQSGKTAALKPNQTILDAAEAAGVSIDSQCRSGICGTCRCKLLSGQVTMAVRDALSDGDEAAGYILACQAQATEDVSIKA